MAEQFPMYRLATLLARQLSAPVAARVKAVARAQPWFRRAVCMRLGRAHRAAELRFKLWALRLPQPRAAPPLADSAALDAGADVLGEIVVFGLGSLIVIIEVNRQATNHEAKVTRGERATPLRARRASGDLCAQKLARRSRWVAAAMQLEELSHELRLQQAELDRLHALLRAVAERRAAARR